MAPCRFLFPILEKIYTVFDPCKSWGRDVIPRSAGARGTMSTNKYLPFPTYIHLGDLWRHAGLNKQISCRLTSATSTTVHITSYLIVNLSPENIQLFFVNDYGYSLRIPLQSYHQTKHLGYGTLIGEHWQVWMVNVGSWWEGFLHLPPELKMLKDFDKNFWEK